MKTKNFLNLSPLGCLGVTIASAGLLLSPALSHPAQACGGFWCSQSAPVNQAAEQIIFVDNADDTVTAIIQIQYEGPSNKFAWLIPIPGKPKIGVSSNVAFQRLDQATAPQYNLELVIEGTCKEPNYLDDSFNGSADRSVQDAGSALPEEAPHIVVIDQGSVGPYDYTTISVDPGLSDPADAAIAWFKAEGYDLSGIDADVLGPYLADGLHLLAFRLTKGSEAGAIRPVSITYQSDLPMIPIRPTAVAAKDDMGIKVWVVANIQAVPKNYKSLVLNEARINWFYFQDTYDAVVTEAANEAQGQGFVTELAGLTKKLVNKVFSADDEAQWQQLKSQQYADGFEAIFAANNLYRDWDGWREAIEASVALPPNASFDDFGRNPEAYRDTAQIDTAKFFAQLEENLVKPARETEMMVQSRPYITRLYSTMSADEMTVDPAFTYNADLAEVSNIHTATQYITCDRFTYQYEAPWRIELPQGGVIHGQGGGEWPLAMSDLPANLKIVQLTTTGAGEIVTDNSGAIDKRLALLKTTAPKGDPRVPPTNGVAIGGDPTTPATNASDSDCSVSAPGKRTQASALWALPLLGLALGRRLRRRSSR